MPSMQGDMRDRILDAAMAILLDRGGNAVTIAAVAKEAGISKGGLFYHFASKEQLIQGLIDRYVQAFDQLLATAGTEKGAATLAYLKSAERPSGPATQPVYALLAASILNPAGLEALQHRYNQWQKRLADDGIPSHIATTIRLAVDGLWLADAFRLAPPTVQERREILATLRGLLA